MQKNKRLNKNGERKIQSGSEMTARHRVLERTRRLTTQVTGNLPRNRPPSNRGEAGDRVQEWRTLDPAYDAMTAQLGKAAAM